ncbi:LacI family DNA-binding transcriptional regulator [Bifidobacterium lemurum]|uniref:LacI family DNA-binding transcriptional regulator n=1 Tax=Bifidobacterium lemurum TaxID=1603886 RepID=UPI0009352473|nr:LacI family DNA-binding transcriptional regulator [Bifidobacterium lemurum]QOL35427.1 LacI family DNA-binding transcriptional regulator [Bifidobacterium lemurum]
MVGERRKAKVTLPDVAKLAGVSVASVSNYLNDYPHMRPTTKQRIQNAIDELGYVVNEQARNLRSGRTGLITLSIPDLNQIYFAELAEEVIKAARTRGYGVIVESTGNDKQRELDSIASMARNMTDGLILSPVKMSNDDVASMEGDFPLVMLGERVFKAPAPHVMMPNEAASRAVTEHLLDAGCRTVAVVGGTLDGSNSSSRSLRTQGYVEAMRHRGLTVDPALVREVGEWTSKNGALAVERMYREGIRPDAIFALNDLLALGVISQLREMRVRVPESVRVVGFDDINEAQYTIPSLTSVNPDRARIAELAVDLILGQVMTGRRASADKYPVPFTLVYRDSSPIMSS